MYTYTSKMNALWGEKKKRNNKKFQMKQKI